MITPEVAPMPRVGLTGGIGSGKSTVAALLAERGAAVIDADRIAREIVEPGEPALDEIGAAFGPDILDGDGGLDRARMARLVFADPAARHRLEAITHPRIEARITETIDRIVTTAEAEPPMIVVDHPLLVEAGLADAFDVVVVVLADVETRVRRIVEQRGMDPQDVRARIDAQADDTERIAAATHVVRNDGTVDELREAAARLFAELAGASTTDQGRREPK